MIAFTYILIAIRPNTYIQAAEAAGGKPPTATGRHEYMYIGMTVYIHIGGGGRGGQAANGSDFDGRVRPKGLPGRPQHGDGHDPRLFGLYKTLWVAPLFRAA